MGLTRCYVGKNGDYTASAKGKDRHNLIVVSGVQIDLSIGQLHNFCDLGNVSGSLFDCNDILNVVEQIDDRFRCNVYAGSALNVVKDDRHFDAVCDCGKVCNQTLLCCFIVIRRNEKKSVHAVFFCFLRQINCCLRAVGAGSCNYRDSVIYFFHGIFDGIQMLLMGQGRSLTGGSADNDGVGSAGDLLLNQFSEFFVIHFLCFGHRCDNCNSCTFKNRHSLFLLYVVSDKTIRNQSPELISHGKFHFPFKKEAPHPR